MAVLGGGISGLAAAWRLSQRAGDLQVNSSCRIRRAGKYVDGLHIYNDPYTCIDTWIATDTYVCINVRHPM